MLRCEECGRTSDDGTGWRAYLAAGDESDVDELEDTACAAREFGT